MKRVALAIDELLTLLSINGDGQEKSGLRQARSSHLARIGLPVSVSHKMIRIRNCFRSFLVYLTMSIDSSLLLWKIAK